MVRGFDSFKAWLDLSQRKVKGESVDQKHIRKHKNDVFRLFNLLNISTSVRVPMAVLQDFNAFLAAMAEEPIDLSQLDIVGYTKEEILDELKKLYISI